MTSLVTRRLVQAWCHSCPAGSSHVHLSPAKLNACTAEAEAGQLLNPNRQAGRAPKEHRSQQVGIQAMASLRPWLAMVVMAVVVPVMPGSGPAAATADDYLHVAPFLLEGDSFSSGEILGGPYDGYALDLQHDCNMVLYPTRQADKQIWSSNTGGLGTDCILLMQDDCNAVLYLSGTQTALWATGTAGHGGGCSFVVLPNGNVVLYDVSGNVLWSAGTGVWS